MPRTQGDMMPSTRLRELQEQYYAKTDALQRIFDQARHDDGSYNFLEAEAFQHVDTQQACLETIDQFQKELDDLAAKVKAQEGIEEQERRNKERQTKLREVV